ncbi:phosphatase PAP2 family protein, partial [bacterium]|nr:phosphatase PAP2 family protein [bacterium]
WINHKLACSFMDFIMPMFSAKAGWIPIILAILIISIWRGGKVGRITALGVIVVFALADPLAARVLKPLFGRIRPCYALGSAVRLLWSCGGKLSFPSNHAANSAAIISVFGYFYRKSLWFGIPIALAVGLSRIYLGVHYPLDVFGGFVLGAIIGIGVAYAEAKYFNVNKQNTLSNNVIRK